VDGPWIKASPGGPGIMILPDVRGLHPFYEELAVHFAEAGVRATAMDYFGRTAGVGERDASFDFMSHVGLLTPDGLGADTAATGAFLRSEAGGQPTARTPSGSAWADGSRSIRPGGITATPG
jgi:dienelactone hydrolase